MSEITILEILLVIILLLCPILAGYFAWRTFKLKKSVELLRIDRNELIEERAKQSNKLRLKGIEMDETKKRQCSDIMFRTIKTGESVIGELLSELERKMILAALNMPEYGDAMKDPQTSFQVRKVYRNLRERIRESLKE